MPHPRRPLRPRRPPTAPDAADSGQDRHRQEDPDTLRAPRGPGHVPDHRQQTAATRRSRAAGVRPGAARADVRTVHGASAPRSGPPTVRRDQLAAAGSAPDIPRHLPAARQRYDGDRHQPRERGPRPGHRHDRSAARPGLPGGGERPRARSLLRRSRGRRAAISVARRPSGQPGGRWTGPRVTCHAEQPLRVRLSGNPARRVAAVRAPISEPPRPCQRAPDAAVPRAFRGKGRRDSRPRPTARAAPLRNVEGLLPSPWIRHPVDTPAREELLYDIKGGGLRPPPAPAAGGRKRPSSPGATPMSLRP